MDLILFGAPYAVAGFLGGFLLGTLIIQAIWRRASKEMLQEYIAGLDKLTDRYKKGLNDFYELATAFVADKEAAAGEKP